MWVGGGRWGDREGKGSVFCISHFHVCLIRKNRESGGWGRTKGKTFYNFIKLSRTRPNCVQLGWVGVGGGNLFELC